MKRPQIYKFLTLDAVDFVLDGSVRITADSVFRELEAREVAAWIGDPLENASETVVDNPENPYSVDDLNAAAPPGYVPLVNIAPGLNVTMRGFTFRYSGDPCFIYSASRGDYDRLTVMMCDSLRADQSRRDSCVEILNLEKLAETVFKFGVVSIGGNPTGVSKLFSSYTINRVRYQNLSFKPGEPMTSPSPFIKHISHRDQSEIRIVFWKPQPGVPNVLDVKIDRPHRFFREKFRNRGHR